MQCNRSERLWPAPTQSPWPTCAQAGQQFDGVTVHRASFPVWPDAERPRAALPGDHELACHGRGPMQAVTSQRHDYVTKKLAADDRCRTAWPTVHLGVGSWCPVQNGGGGGRCPMDDATTTAAAFAVSAAGTGPRRPSARPSTAGGWLVGDACMAAETECSSSYRPWDPPQPLTRRRVDAAYCRPTVAVSDCTVYAGSFRPPGVFRDPLPGELPPAVWPNRGLGCRRPDDDAGRLPATVYPRAHHYHLQ